VVFNLLESSTMNDATKLEILSFNLSRLRHVQTNCYNQHHTDTTPITLSVAPDLSSVLTTTAVELQVDPELIPLCTNPPKALNIPLVDGCVTTEYLRYISAHVKTTEVSWRDVSRQYIPGSHNSVLVLHIQVLLFLAYKFAKEAFLEVAQYPILPPHWYENSWWCFLMCLNRIQAHFPKELLKVLYEKYVSVQFPKKCQNHYGLRQILNGEKWPKLEHPCYESECPVKISQWSVSCSSKLLFEQWIKEHLQQYHQITHEKFLANYDNCSNCDSINVDTSSRWTHHNHFGVTYVYYCKMCGRVVDKEVIYDEYVYL